MSNETNKDDQERKGLSRRSFLKNTGIGVASAATGASLMGSQAVAAQDAPTVMTAELAAQKWSFEIAPDPIPDSDIAHTIEAEVVVIGAGVSGTVAAASAAEHGAKVVLISASAAPVYRGGSFMAPRSTYTEKMGYETFDVDKYFRRELSSASFNVDMDKWFKFYNNSEEAINWLIEKMEAAGYETVLEVVNHEPDFGPMEIPLGAHGWLSENMRQAGMGAEFVVNVLADSAQANGAEIYYKTVARQLVREDNNTGRVTAVIAQGEDGTYTKYVGSKAIILATGDFSTDKEMMAKYCPWARPLLDDTGDQGYDNTFKMGGLMPGDGHKMALWVGAAWQKTFPNAPMIGCYALASPQPYGAHRGLTVNKNGYRYGTEDVTGPLGGVHQMMHQPNMESYSIWDTNYAAAAGPWYELGMVEGSDPIPPEKLIATWDVEAKIGSKVKGDTLEEVIEQLGLPLEATLATIERYNGFCENGADEDYHKRPELLIPIAEPPFYGGKIAKPDFLTVLGGLRTNIHMQVCDENDAPLPGLYNVGTMVGDYFANTYNFQIPGNNLGANCLTFGYLTGRDIANGTLA